MNENTTATDHGYVLAYTAGGGQALHIVRRTADYYNGYAKTALCGTAPAAKWGTGSLAVRWMTAGNDTTYTTAAEAAAARPVCKRCAAAARKAEAAAEAEAPAVSPRRKAEIEAGFMPEVTPAPAPVDESDPATWTEGGGYTWETPCSACSDGEMHYTRVSDGRCISCDYYAVPAPAEAEDAPALHFPMYREPVRAAHDRFCLFSAMCAAYENAEDHDGTRLDAATAEDWAYGYIAESLAECHCREGAPKLAEDGALVTAAEALELEPQRRGAAHYAYVAAAAEVAAAGATAATHDVRAAWRFIVDSYDTGYSPNRRDWTDASMLAFVAMHHTGGLDAFRRTEDTPEDAPARGSHWAMEYPALNGTVVMQGHADYCRAHGHATHSNDGDISPWCPRCGAMLNGDTVTDAAMARALELAAMAAPGAHRVDTGRKASDIAGGVPLRRNGQDYYPGALATVISYFQGGPGRGECVDAVIIAASGGANQPQRVSAATDALERLQGRVSGNITAGQYQTIATGPGGGVLFIFGTWNDGE